MKHEKLSEAMDQIDPQYLEDAAKPKKTFHIPLSAFAWAAVLALVILCIPLVQQIQKNRETNITPTLAASGDAMMQETATPESPMENGHMNSLYSYSISHPVYPSMAPYPTDEMDMSQSDAYYESRREQYDQPKGYADSLHTFWMTSIPQVLSGEENAVYSPINTYMALAMLAETAEGNTRQQILDVLGAQSIEALRTQAGYVWNAHYCADGATTLLLGNSLWMDDTLLYNKETANLLANDYYAAVYHGDLQSETMNQAMQDWLNAHTGNLLQDQVRDLTFEDDTLMGLASTIHYKVKWMDAFQESQTTSEIFHTPTGDVTAEFMHSTQHTGTYFYGEDFGAVKLNTEDRSTMWLILPDEGLTPKDLLESGHAMDMIFSYASPHDYPNTAYVRINLSVPKFDVASDLELKEPLCRMGITDVFQEGTADFSAISPDPLFLSRVQHAGRVMIDEEGIDAAAYTMMLYCGSAMPPDDEIDFVLDRPFLFVIESNDGLPLFVGVVNEP